MSQARKARAELHSAFFRWLAAEITPFLPPGPSDPPSVTLIREVNDMLIYELNLPIATAADVAKWELSETVDGETPTVKDATEGMELSYTDGQVVALKVRGIDDAGNVAEWSPDFVFTAADTIAPPPSGSPGVRLAREE